MSLLRTAINHPIQKFLQPLPVRKYSALGLSFLVVLGTLKRQDQPPILIFSFLGLLEAQRWLLTLPLLQQPSLCPQGMQHQVLEEEVEAHALEEVALFQEVSVPLKRQAVLGQKPFQERMELQEQEAEAPF